MIAQDALAVLIGFVFGVAFAIPVSVFLLALLAISARRKRLER